MIYILLCILANVGIFLCFRSFSRFRMDTLQAIVVNYVVCIITGLLFIGDLKVIASVDYSATWVWLAGLLGLVFISTFNLMAITTQRLGITVASVASKMSLIIPVLVSILVFGTQSKSYSVLNYLGIFLAIVAILLSSVKDKRGTKQVEFDFLIFLLPIAVFLLGGLIDTSINFLSLKYVSGQEEAILPIVIFASAFLFGSLFLIVKRKKINLRSVVGGSVLGVINYFSIYFLVKGLSSFNHDGALVYPVLNVGIILFSAIFSIVLFREKLSLINKVGLAMSIVAVILIFNQELFN